MEIKLTRAFAPDRIANETDIRQLKKALNRIGYYQPLETIGIIGMPDRHLQSAIRTFQKDQGLPSTGTITPGDNTERALNKEISKTPQGQYIWRTAGDKKVRAGHAELNGTMRSWADSLNPGDEFNCRCWAEPIEEYPPIPSRKPNCNDKKATFNKTEENHKNAELRQSILQEELKKLVEENNQTVRELQKTLGYQIATSIIDLPLERLGAWGEILQIISGNIMSDKVKEKAEKLGRNLSLIRRNIANKKAQLNIASAELAKAQKDLKEAKDALEVCQNNIPGNK